MKVQHSFQCDVNLSYFRYGIWLVGGEEIHLNKWKFDRGTIMIEGTVKRPTKTITTWISINALLPEKKVNHIKSHKKSQQIMMNNIVNGERYGI